MRAWRRHHRRPLAAEHLLGSGTGVSRSSRVRVVQSGRERMAGYWLGLRAAGNRADEALAMATLQSPDAGADAIAALIGCPRGGGHGADHRQSLAGYGALLRCGSGRGGAAELSVVCYEDSPLARWWHPAMTVIDNNARQMASLPPGSCLTGLSSSRRRDRDVESASSGGRPAGRARFLGPPAAGG